jgi:Sec-independent protein translocase protein TatA
MVLGVKVGVVDYKDPEYIQKQLSNVMSLIEGDIHGQLVEIDFLQNHLKEKEDEKTDEEAESLKELNDLYEEIVVFATSELPECAKRIVDAAKDARDAEEDEEADDKEEEGDKAEGDDIMDFKTMASSQVYGFNQRLEEINKELGNPTMPSNYGNVTIINNFNVIGDFGGLRPPQNYGVEDPSWPDGAVIATVNVLFTVTEEHEVLKVRVCQACMTDAR